jgi:hypothetical protein
MKTTFFALLFCLLFPLAAFAQRTYYVSESTGNDNWSGRRAKPNLSATDGPFRTLTKAQTAMRGSSIKKTTVRAGTYSLDSVWSFTSSDDRQTWIGYPGETAIIDGGGTHYISLDTVSNVTFQALTFRATGGTDLYGTSFSPAGLYLGGSDHIRIGWNTFLDCVLACITADGNPTNNIVTSNTFNGQTPGNHSGDVNSFYAAIMFWYGASNNQITYNLIQNTAGGGVIFATGVDDPPFNNNVIDRNILKTTCNNVYDCGALYIYDGSHSVTGNSMTNNIVDGNGGANYLANFTKSFYIDDLMSNITVSGNLCRNCGTFAFQIHAGDHVTVANNIFDLSLSGSKLCEYDRSPIADFGMAGNVVTKNLIYWADGTPSTLWLVDMNQGDALPNLHTNLYFSATGANIPNVDVVDSNRILADPLFANPEAGDYSMPGNSPAFTQVVFTPLVTNQGPRPMTRRKW